MGTLYIVATPIGNLDDITLRAIKILFSADYIAAEDTRRTGQLLDVYRLKIENGELHLKDLDVANKAKLISFYDEIEMRRIPELLDLLSNGKDIALVSDAGTPLISDPGYKLVRECLVRNIKVESIPGPSAVTTALTLSGLPPNIFTFIGYLPPKQTSRLKTLNKIKHAIAAAELKMTIIFFESAERLNSSLSDLKDVFGETEIVICREMTKIHEEIIRGNVTDCLRKTEQLKGELVILVRI